MILPHKGFLLHHPLNLVEPASRVIYGHRETIINPHQILYIVKGAKLSHSHYRRRTNGRRHAQFSAIGHWNFQKTAHTTKQWNKCLHSYGWLLVRRTTALMPTLIPSVLSLLDASCKYTTAGNPSESKNTCLIAIRMMWFTFMATRMISSSISNVSHEIYLLRFGGDDNSYLHFI